MPWLAVSQLSCRHTDAGMQLAGMQHGRRTSYCIAGALGAQLLLL